MRSKHGDNDIKKPTICEPHSMASVTLLTKPQLVEVCPHMATSTSELKEPRKVSEGPDSRAARQ